MRRHRRASFGAIAIFAGNGISIESSRDRNDPVTHLLQQTDRRAAELVDGDEPLPA